MSNLGRLVCDEWGTVNDSRECPPPTSGKVLKVLPYDSQQHYFHIRKTTSYKREYCFSKYKNK